MTDQTMFRLPFFFMWHIGHRDRATGTDKPIIFIFAKETERDDAVQSAKAHGHDVRTIDWREAFALRVPDDDGYRTFRDQAGWETRLEPNWTPEKEYPYEEDIQG